tara:strand:+ start:713 stop:2137 length:1425 start_codon:yes stop_codon:yes gene_type:complete
MNFISWATKPTIINENTQSYVPQELVEESIAKTLKPVMNKMKKLNIGVPYRDSRVFFFKFLQDKYPDIVPAGFETRKPSGKDVNAIVGQIAIEQPELLNSMGAEFEQYSTEKTESGLDRVSQFLNTAATLRQGKGVRPKSTEGYVKKDYSKLTAQEIADATTDAIAKKQEDFDAGDDVSDEKLLLRTAVSSVLGQLEKEDVNQEALDNVAEAVAKIDSLAEFEKFLNYIADFEEYSVIYQYLVDTIDVIETNLGDMQAQKEDEEYNAMAAEDEIDLKKADLDNDGEVSEYELTRAKAAFGDEEDAENCSMSDEEIDKEKSDLDNDGEISEYEKSRGEAIAKAMKKEQERAGQSHARAVADHYEDEESNLENTPLEELSTLTPEEYEMVQNFENFDADDWGYNKLQRFYFRKREGGEEDEEFSTNRYMSLTPTETREENEEVRMSQLEINQHLAVQERQRLQNLYAQQRRHTHGY